MAFRDVDPLGGASSTVRVADSRGLVRNVLNCVDALGTHLEQYVKRTTLNLNVQLFLAEALLQCLQTAVSSACPSSARIEINQTISRQVPISKNVFSTNFG